MKASLLYRISAILLVLFAIGHTLGFRQIDPNWGVDSLVQSMKSIHFNANGADRTLRRGFPAVNVERLPSAMSPSAKILGLLGAIFPLLPISAFAWTAVGNRLYS